jgi:hypothetical protein
MTSRGRAPDPLILTTSEMGSGEAKAALALSATTQMIAKMAFGLMAASSPMQSGVTE